MTAKLDDVALLIGMLIVLGAIGLVSLVLAVVKSTREPEQSE